MRYTVGYNEWLPQKTRADKVRRRIAILLRFIAASEVVIFNIDRLIKLLTIMFRVAPQMQYVLVNRCLVVKPPVRPPSDRLTTNLLPTTIPEISQSE